MKNRNKSTRYKEGDILQSANGYRILLCKDKNKTIYGSLICPIGHSSRNIPYFYDNEEDYILIATKMEI